MKIHLTIRVSGRVQGVFYRASALKSADALGVNGFVRNEPNGSVYLEAEGEREAVLRFVEWCRKGPPGARVESCETQEGPLQDFDCFDIRK